MNNRRFASAGLVAAFLPVLIAFGETSSTPSASVPIQVGPEVLATAERGEGAVERPSSGVQPEVEADLGGSGDPELLDFLAFSQAFSAGDMAADCDGSGSLDLFDYLCFFNSPGDAQGKPPKDPPAPLTWTLEEGYAGSGDWSYATQQAALSEAVGTDGNTYTDWRLPTIAELQAALKQEVLQPGAPGGFGHYHPNVLGVRFWSASGSGGTGVGSWAYVCFVYTDASGTVIAPSGDVVLKEYKNGGHPAKFVRP